MTFANLNESMEGMDSGVKGKWLHGTVTENADPLNLDRVQASIPGLLDPNQGEVPWLMPFKMSPFGCGATWGVYGVPAIGSDVKVWFQDGRTEYGMYMSELVKANSEFPSGTAWGFVDPDGNKLRVEGQHVQFHSGSGVVIDIDAAGKLTITTPSDCEVNCGGDATVNANSGTVNIPETTWTGNLAVYGNLDVHGYSHMTGNIDLTGTFTNNGINMTIHHHGGVHSGGDISGTPE